MVGRAKLVGCAMSAAVTVVIAAGASAAQSSDVDGVASSPSVTFAAGRVLVHYSDTTDAAAQASVEHAAGASRVGRIDDLGVTVLRVPEGAEDRVVAALTKSGKADYAERDGLVQATQTPNDPYWGSQQWGPAKVNAPMAWDITTGAAATTVAVLDTGADLAHADLQGRTTAGYDFINGDNDPTDDHGHGTKSAGVVGAATNNGMGVSGMCWICTLMPVKVLDSTSSGTYSALISGITWAVDHGADVISMSLSGSSDSQGLHDAVRYAHDHDVVLVGSAGNDGSTTQTYPAAYDEVLGVAGTTSSDSRYSWSNYGSWVKLAAPGCAYTTARGGTYASFCGTSAAAPLVAGVAALMRSKAPLASSIQVENALEASSVPVAGVVQFGRVDAPAALAGLTASPTPSPSPTASPAASPTASPTASPAASPTASPTAAPSTTTTTSFSGSLTGKNPERTFGFRSGAGALQATLSFAKASTLSLDLTDDRGTVLATSTGGSPVNITKTVQSGPYQLVVRGDGTRASFSLKVTTPA